LRTGKWSELPVNKSPKIVHFAIGHEGLHAVLVAEDGTVFFAGTARRGEDGDQSEYNGGHLVLCWGCKPEDCSGITVAIQ